MMSDQLPEGTDTIIEGAGVGEDDEEAFTPAQEERSSTGSQGHDAGNADGQAKASGEQPGSEHQGDIKGQFFDRIDELRGQAGDRARDFAQSGKDRATQALDNLVQMVEDAAAEIDDKLGGQYGDYARRAASGIGNFTDSFRDRDVDELFADARELVKKSPAVAIGAAAAIGFVVARLARARIPDASGSDAPKA
jgi:ElaB/YqjD/DUF883 family membrane-anchored ribosome-binding protein